MLSSMTCYRHSKGSHVRVLQVWERVLGPLLEKAYAKYVIDDVCLLYLDFTVIAVVVTLLNVSLVSGWRWKIVVLISKRWTSAVRAPTLWMLMIVSGILQWKGCWGIFCDWYNTLILQSKQVSLEVSHHLLIHFGSTSQWWRTNDYIHMHNIIRRKHPTYKLCRLQKDDSHLHSSWMRNLLKSLSSWRLKSWLSLVLNQGSTWSFPLRGLKKPVGWNAADYDYH